MRRLVYILTLILCISCAKDKKKELSYILAGNDYKYWDIVYNQNLYNRSISKTFPLYCYRFDKNSNWNLLVYKGGSRQSYEHPDIVFPRKWHLLSDSAIILGNKTYKIDKLSNDTFIYKAEKADSTVLIRSSKK